MSLPPTTTLFLYLRNLVLLFLLLIRLFDFLFPHVRRSRGICLSPSDALCFACCPPGPSARCPRPPPQGWNHFSEAPLGLVLSFLFLWWPSRCGLGQVSHLVKYPFISFCLVLRRVAWAWCFLKFFIKNATKVTCVTRLLLAVVAPKGVSGWMSQGPGQTRLRTGMSGFRRPSWHVC